MRTLLLLVLLNLPLQWSYSQTDFNDSVKLISLGKLYGFLKYYHPNVAGGTFNWDQQLLDVFPLALKAQNTQELSQVYLRWIESLGPYDTCESCEEAGAFFEANFDLEWLNERELFTPDLSAQLNHIRQNRAQNGNHYVTAGPAGQVQITNEPVYPDLGYPKEAQRLLGLYKYWNVIEYFYPYKYLNDTRWDTVLEGMIPEFRNASNLEAYQQTIKKLVAQVDDSHVWISLNPDKKSQYLPIRITNIDQKMVVFGYYDEALADQNNLKLGDVITHINGKAVASSVAALWPYRGGSNENHRRIRIYYDLLNSGSGPLDLTIQRGDQSLVISAERYGFDRFNYRDSETNPSAKSLDDEVGYINMISLGGKEIGKIFKEFKDKKAIIIDVRNYSTQTLYRTTHFLNTQDRVFAKIYKPNFNYPGKFFFDKGPKTQSSNRAFKGKVIVLVNHESISWSEFTAMALQTAPNVITVGSQTAGADGNVVVFGYMGGYPTAISGLGIMYPDGRVSQRQGIAIDHFITPSIQGLQAGRDEVLEKAIELAKQ